MLSCLGNNYAFSKGKTVCLDNSGQRSRFNIFQSVIGILEDLIGRRWNAVFFHEVFGEDFTALDDGSLGLRAETRNANFLQAIHTAEYQRVVRCYYGEVHRVLLGKFDNAVQIRCPNFRDAGGVCSNAAVSGKGVDFLHVRIFFDFGDDGVLSSAAADYHDFHGLNPFRSL